MLTPRCKHHNLERMYPCVCVRLRMCVSVCPCLRVCVCVVFGTYATNLGNLPSRQMDAGSLNGTVLNGTLVSYPNRYLVQVLNSPYVGILNVRLWLKSPGLDCSETKLLGFWLAPLSGNQDQSKGCLTVILCGSGSTRMLFDYVSISFNPNLTHMHPSPLARNPQLPSSPHLAPPPSSPQTPPHQWVHNR